MSVPDAAAKARFDSEGMSRECSTPNRVLDWAHFSAPNDPLQRVALSQQRVNA
ncbi:MAG TPA: hypothetical protein VM821_01105 [Abditibacteriaceae bacterium]|nr:hypothetical protein [Abditibacteriaceae bacterium]